jgi:outer membrane murein-binding lipoprotein Lpp
MMTSKTRGLLALIVISSVLAGCGAQDKPLQTGSAGSEPTATVAPSLSPSPEATPVPTEAPTPPAKQSVEATIYLTDAELLETVERKATLEYASDSELLEAAVAALQQDAGEDALSLWKDIEVHSLKLEDGQVTLDIHIPDEARLGAPGELLFIATLQKTLFQFEFVQSIDLLVDGEAVESVMGHVELEHPIKKES